MVVGYAVVGHDISLSCDWVFSGCVCAKLHEPFASLTTTESLQPLPVYMQTHIHTGAMRCLVFLAVV